MGMDYIGRRGNGFSLNWTGHSYVASLLEQLGADLSDWDGLNDGNYVPAKVCEDWAGLIRRNVEKVREMTIQDEGFVGGLSHLPVVDGAFESASTVGLTAVIVSMRGEKLRPDRVGPLRKRMKRTLLSLAEFLENCGGCWQY